MGSKEQSLLMTVNTSQKLVTPKNVKIIKKKILNFPYFLPQSSFVHFSTFNDYYLSYKLVTQKDYNKHKKNS